MRKRSILVILFLPIALHLFCLFFLHFSDNFHARNFEHGFDPTYTTNVSGLDYASLDSTLGQPFHFLGQGKQMTAFESADGRTVLKLFNPMRPFKKRWYTEWKLWKRYTSLKWISREWFQKKERLAKLFKRHQLAYDLLRDETGLIFVYLAPSEKISHYAHVTDRQGRKHIIALHNTPFVLQEKAILASHYLHQLAKENKLDEATLAIEKLKQLFAKRIEVGITDRIQTMENNYGFVGAKPIQIDVGRIRMDSTLHSNPEEEHKRILNSFQAWLTHHYPEIKDFDRVGS